MNLAFDAPWIGSHEIGRQPRLAAHDETDPALQMIGELGIEALVARRDASPKAAWQRRKEPDA